MEELLKKLQAANSLSERMKILKENGKSQNDICEACKSAKKHKKLNMCVVVDWCRWDLSFKWFRKERQKQNEEDCKNFTSDKCFEHCETLDKNNHEQCENCKWFELKEENKE